MLGWCVQWKQNFWLMYRFSTVTIQQCWWGDTARWCPATHWEWPTWDYKMQKSPKTQRQVFYCSFISTWRTSSKKLCTFKIYPKLNLGTCSDELLASQKMCKDIHSSEGPRQHKPIGLLGSNNSRAALKRNLGRTSKQKMINPNCCKPYRPPLYNELSGGCKFQVLFFFCRERDGLNRLRMKSWSPECLPAPQRRGQQWAGHWATIVFCNKIAKTAHSKHHGMGRCQCLSWKTPGILYRHVLDGWSSW